MFLLHNNKHLLLFFSRGATQSRTPNKSGIGWGAMYWQYYQDLDKIQGQSGSLKITKKLFVEKILPTKFRG